MRSIVFLAIFLSIQTILSLIKAHILWCPFHCTSKHQCMAHACTYKPDVLTYHNSQARNTQTKDWQKKMASSLPSRPLALFVSLLLILPLARGTEPVPAPILTYHGGDLLAGKINLALLWYGQFGNSQKKVIRSFIKSLNYDGGANFEPQVLSWWQMVGSYQSFTGKKSKRSPGLIKVQVAGQVTDTSFSMGKVMTVDFIKVLVQKATAGKPNDTLAVIFTSRQVTASDLCMGKCSEHGVIGNTTFPLFLNNLKPFPFY